MSAFFHARQSSEILPEKMIFKPTKRNALAERSASQMNSEASQPTIRLVDPESSSPSVYEKTPFPRLPSQVLKPPKTTKHGYTIQDDSNSPMDQHPALRPTSQNGSNRLVPTPLNLKQTKRQSNRASTSTTGSTADTLLNDSLFSPTSCRFSLDGTLRNTPTPNEEREKEREREQRPASALAVLREDSLERATIRPVTASSDSKSDRPTHSSGSDIIRPYDDRLPPTPPRHNRLASIDSLPTPASEDQVGSSPRDVNASSEYSSSPSNAERSSCNIIRYVSSTESMAVQYAQVRPPTARSQAASSSWTGSESENIAPLAVARKRTHMHSASEGVNRQSALSTIASVSEPSSGSKPRSRFSGGSELGMMKTQPEQTQARRRTIGSSSSGSNYETVSSSSSHATFTRAESAVPMPLFSSTPPRAGAYELAGDSPAAQTEGEQDDTIAELHAPQLRTKRSGYLARRRSTSDPRPSTARTNTSRTEPDRGSTGSSIFPQWAKQFYRGTSYLGSANGSKVSLSQPHESPSMMRMMPWAIHRRWQSTGTALTAPGTPHSGYLSSPGSSHFLPSIFRPRVNMHAYTDTMTSTNNGYETEEVYDEDHEEEEEEEEEDYGHESSSSSRNSMAITAAPPPRNRQEPGTPTPRAPRRNRNRTARQASNHLPRDPTYTSSQYPRSHSASQIFTAPPHLAPSRRLSHRLSAWRAPSFDEALNTLFVTRCNRQILLFCLGFVCPLLWMVAAFLPIPPRPADPRVNANVNDLEDLNGKEGQYALGVQMEMIDWEEEKRFLKARWWRTLNRIMSVVGVVVIAAIVSTGT